MFSRFFIERPIFATVLSLLIVLAGLVSVTALPVAQYPNITPVQITVTTTYPGADAKTVGDSVASPIEAQINGVDNMMYMTSVSSNTGQLTITVYFTLDTDPDIAQVQVQNRVNLAAPQLPSAVAQYGVSVQKKSDQIMKGGGASQGRTMISRPWHMRTQWIERQRTRGEAPAGTETRAEAPAGTETRGEAPGRLTGSQETRG